MVFPPLLHVGDKIGIIAPAGKLPNNGLQEAITTLSSWGLEVVVSKNATRGYNYFSGTDQERLADLQEAFDDPSLSAVLAARGGYGLTRILQSIDFEHFISKPKWLIGFSDITALHLQLIKNKVASIHGPMATSFINKAALNSLESLKHLLFNGISNITSTDECIRPKKVTAELTGGNLSLVLDSLGTSNEIYTDNKILFLEDVGEKTYRIDRMLHQLYRAEKLSNLAGLVIGHFTDIGDGKTPFGMSWKDCIVDITSSFDYPVSFGWEVGHEPKNHPLVIGGVYNLQASATGASLNLLMQG